MYLVPGLNGHIACEFAAVAHHSDQGSVISRSKNITLLATTYYNTAWVARLPNRTRRIALICDRKYNMEIILFYSSLAATKLRVLIWYFLHTQGDTYTFRERTVQHCLVPIRENNSMFHCNSALDHALGVFLIAVDFVSKS